MLFILLIPALLWGQVHKEVIRKELSFEKSNSSNVFLLANINGSVEAEGYDGNVVILEAQLQLKAKTMERLNAAKQQISLGFLDRYDSIIVFVKGPCGDEDTGISKKGKRQKWYYQWNNCDINYDFNIDFKLKIPNDLNIYLSTINNGDIEVNGINGSLDLHNINGDISASGAKKYTYAHTINGDLTLEYDDTPGPNSSYYTLNGDIKAYLPSDFQAEVTFKSYNGDIYTDFEEIQQQPMMFRKQSEEAVTGIAFKLESRSVISFGGGGPQLDFETFNGDAYLRKN